SATARRTRSSATTKPSPRRRHGRGATVANHRRRAAPPAALGRNRAAKHRSCCVPTLRVTSTTRRSPARPCASSGRGAELRHHVVRFEVRLAHHLGEARVAPRPAHRPALLVEVPALAAGHPDAALGGLDTILVELFE